MTPVLKKTMTEWAFSEPKLVQLPQDSVSENYIRRNVPKAIFSQVWPTPFETERKLVAASPEVLRDILDMDPSTITLERDFVDWVSGNKVIEGALPLAHRYGGYQFGMWASQLGDGRAHLLGEYVNSKGEHWELQLKGSGKTPYSRFGDGRAVLRSSVREFLCSEAMFHLGVPTSRAAALVVSNDTVMRDIFYDGHGQMERCAVVLRLAPTWFRIGSLEILARSGEMNELRTLVNYLLANHFKCEENGGFDEKVLAMFSTVVEKTAALVAHWMSVGFTHGVLNTDNMSLESVTIDYGPFGFLDEYNVNYIPNHSDDGGRYDYESQPAIAYWNMNKLAMSLTPILPPTKHAQLKQILNGFNVRYQEHFLNLFTQKLGLVFDPDKKEELNELVTCLLDCMESTRADFTQTFRDLSEVPLEDFESSDQPKDHWGLAKVKRSRKFPSFVKKYKQQLLHCSDDAQRRGAMKKANPRYVLRNWMAQSAIKKAENDDFSEVQLLLNILTSPYEENQEAEKAGYAKPPPDWSKQLVVSCSS